LDHVIEFIHEKAKPSLFLSYLRILSFVEGFEDDLIASDVCPVIADLIDDNPHDEQLQIDILKFLANLCNDSEARQEIGNQEHNIIELVRKKMESKEYQFSRSYQRAALIFLTNLTEDNVENKENVSIDCVEVVMGALNMLNYSDIALPALYLVKNITTNIHVDYITDINDHNCVENVIKSIARFPESKKIVATAFSILPNLVAKRAKTKRTIKEPHINIILNALHSTNDPFVIRDGFVFLLFIAKIANIRQLLGVNCILIALEKLKIAASHTHLVPIIVNFIDRLLICKSNVAGFTINPAEKIQFLLSILPKYPKDRTIHLAICKIIRILVDYDEVPEILRANDGITTLISSMNTFGAPIKNFVQQILDLTCETGNDDEDTEIISKKEKVVLENNVKKRPLPTIKYVPDQTEAEKLYIKINSEVSK